jgi:Ca2+-binding RTX toxin-like protein
MKKTMSCLGAAAALTLGVLVSAPGAASATTPTPTTVNFTGESGPKPNGYTTAAQPGVRFFDTAGSDLYVFDFGSGFHGPGLLDNSYDGSGIDIRLTGPTTGISLAFGYDYSLDDTDLGQLTLYRGANQVGQVEVNVNANGALDQQVSFGGRLFNRAVFRYVDGAGNPKAAYEVIDDIAVNPICTVAGNDGNNVLRGTGSRDVICGDTGNDTIVGKGGNDLVYPGGGNDTTNAGPGADTVIDGSGNDRVNGNDGADDVRGGAGRDRVTGGTGPDSLNGGIGRDYCNGGAGHDHASSCEVKRSIP